MPDFLPFIIFGFIFVAVIVVVVIRGRAAGALRKQRLMEMGFTPLQDDSALVETITRLENNKEYRYSVKDSMRAAVKGREIFFYEKSRHRTGSIYATEELLFPLTRPSGHGLMLFVKPDAIPHGTATNLIGALATGAWDAQPDDLTRLPLPADLEGSNLLGAMGPAGSSLAELIDRSALNRMLQSGNFGAFIILCRDNLCSVSSPQPRMPLDMEKALRFLSDLVSG